MYVCGRGAAVYQNYKSWEWLLANQHSFLTSDYAPCCFIFLQRLDLEVWTCIGLKEFLYLYSNKRCCYQLQEQKSPKKEWNLEINFKFRLANTFLLNPLTPPLFCLACSAPAKPNRAFLLQNSITNIDHSDIVIYLSQCKYNLGNKTCWVQESFAYTCT